MPPVEKNNQTDQSQCAWRDGVLFFVANNDSDADGSRAAASIAEIERCIDDIRKRGQEALLLVDASKVSSKFSARASAVYVSFFKSPKIDKIAVVGDSGHAQSILRFIPRSKKKKNHSFAREAEAIRWLKRKAMQKKTLMVFISVGLLAGIGAGLYVQSTFFAFRSTPLITIERAYDPGHFWIDIAEKKGWFEEAGLSVAVVDANARDADSFVPAVNEQVDFQSMALFDLMAVNALSADMAAVLSDKILNEQYAILSKQGVNTVSDLRGKRVGVAVGSRLDYFLYTLLHENEITPDEITAVDMLPALAAGDIVSKQLDAVVTVRMFSDDVVATNEFHELFTTEDVFMTPSIFVANRSFIEQREEDVQQIVGVWRRATEWIAQHPGETYALIADRHGHTAEDVRQFSLSAARVLGLNENKIAFSFSSGVDSYHGQARAISNFLQEKDIIKQSLLSANFLDSRFINRLR